MMSAVDYSPQDFRANLAAIQGVAADQYQAGGIRVSKYKKLSIYLSE